MNLFKRCTILFLLTAVFAHAAAAYAPVGETAEACETDCCAALQQMTLLVPPEPFGAAQCCVISFPPDTETVPVFTLNKPASATADGLLASLPVARWAASRRVQVPRTLPRYLPDSSCRYLQTGALLI